MLPSRRLTYCAAIVLGAAAGALLVLPAYAGTRPVPAAAGREAPARPQASCQQQSFLEGTHLSAVQVAQLAQQAGFTGNDWVTSVAVAEAESSGWTHARLIDTDCSVDRGLWQINSFWHGEVSDACAFDPACNAQGAHTIWANGGWTQWTTFTNGAYQAHLAEAQAAVNQVGGGGGGGGGGGCNAANWVAGQWYPTGSIVRYTNGNLYIATHDNPGYDPTISTWFWSPFSCGGGGGGGGGGSCSAPAWSSSQVYVGGNQVTFNGHTWRAKWWTQGERPGAADVWADQGSC
jgi:Lysozyme like domain/Carbohydrate-binding module family 5/12